VIDLFSKELRGISTFLKIYYREIVVLTSAVLFPVLSKYHLVWNQWFSSLLYYTVLPVLVIVFLLRRSPLDFGLRFGNCSLWGFHVLIACVVGFPLLYIASRCPSLQSYYEMEQFILWQYALITTLIIFAWEFLFRGFMLFGLKERLGQVSILIQMVPFVLLHIGKPELETISTVVMGMYLGYVAYRSNSFWLAFIIHLFINISFVTFVNML